MKYFISMRKRAVFLGMLVSRARFTWERGNIPKTNIRERLDRGVANDDWFSLLLPCSFGSFDI